MCSQLYRAWHQRSPTHYFWVLSDSFYIMYFLRQEMDHVIIFICIFNIDAIVFSFQPLAIYTMSIKLIHLPVVSEIETAFPNTRKKYEVSHTSRILKS